MNPAFLLNIAARAFQAGWQIGTWLAGNAGIGAVIQVVNTQASMLNDWINTELWSQVRVNGAWNSYLHPDSQSMKTDILHAFGNVDASLKHITGVIIPATVKTGTSRNWGGIRGLRHQISVMVASEARTQGEVTRLHHWINSQVNPYITGYKKWVHTWDTYYAKPMQSLIDWIAAPALLSAKLAPSMTDDVVWELQHKSERGNVDKLLRVLLAHAPDVMPALDQALVRIWNSGSY